MKTLTKAALCGVYKYSGAMHLQEAIARWKGKPFMSVLLFHRVTDEIPEDGLTVSTARFRRMCKMLLNSFRVVPLAEVLGLLNSQLPIPARTLAITFDDCYRDNLFAARTLAEFGLPSTFFVPTRYVGTDHRFPWDHGLKPLPNLTWADVKEMVQLGFEIGSHTASHANLAEVSLDQMRHELAESKAMLEDKLGRPARYLAYPFGLPEYFRPERMALVHEAGFEECMSGFGGFIYREPRPAIVPREPVPYFKSILNLELHLTGCLDWFYKLKGKGRLEVPPEREVVCQP